MMLNKLDLFNAREGGYTNYRVPGLLATGSGVVLAIVEARRGRGGDWDENDLLLRRSVDGGQTWEPVRCLAANADYGPGPMNNCVPLWDRETRAVHLLYCHDYARVYTVTSPDEGATFTDPVDITESLTPFREQYPWRVVATGPGHGIQLRSGRFVVPLWMSTGEGQEFGSGRLGHRPSAVAALYSDDHGQSWQRSEIMAAHSDEIPNPSETVAVELSDGRVLCNIRSEATHNRRLLTVSPNGSGGWSAPAPHAALREPVCMGSMLRYDPVPGAMLFANPDNVENDLTPPGNSPKRDRKRLTVKLSRDDAATWPVARVLEPGPAGYSDLALMPDGTVLCLYERGMVDRMSDPAAVTLARFDLDWLTAAA